MRLNDYIESAETPIKDGDFIRATIGSDDKGGVATSVWGFRIALMGNVENKTEPVISDLKLFIDGKEQVISFEFAGCYYREGSNETIFDYLFSERYTQKPAKYWVEMTVNGEKVKSETTDWKADGTASYID